MPIIAVTGASGFIGKRLIERLCRDGVSVRALMRKRPAKFENACPDIIHGRLNDDDAITALIEGADAVVHLAGLIKARTRQVFFDVNETGVGHLAKIAAADARPPKLVLISSLAAREPALSSYAASKRAGEEALSALGDAAPFPWTIVRPPAVYGPGDRETLSFFKGVKRGIGAMLGPERARISLIHVDDLVDLIIMALDPAVADRQILEPDDGMDGGHSWRSMVAAAETALSKRALRLQIPKVLLSALGHANAGLRLLPGYTPMLTPEKVREITHVDWVSDRRSITKSTDWKPGIPLDRGFRATIDWYQLHGWL